MSSLVAPKSLSYHSETTNSPLSLSEVSTFLTLTTSSLGRPSFYTPYLCFVHGSRSRISAYNTITGRRHTHTRGHAASRAATSIIRPFLTGNESNSIRIIGFKMVFCK
ncbi:unnamed protein product, partial [Laminaria digitata]